MLANRFVEFFFEKVSKWQHNLGAVDTCMIKWMEVQKQWSNLYPAVGPISSAGGTRDTVEMFLCKKFYWIDASCANVQFNVQFGIN